MAARRSSRGASAFSKVLHALRQVIGRIRFKRVTSRERCDTMKMPEKFIIHDLISDCGDDNGLPSKFAECYDASQDAAANIGCIDLTLEEVIHLQNWLGRVVLYHVTNHGGGQA